MKKLVVALAGLALCSLSAAAQKKPVPKAKTTTTPVVSAATIAQGKTVYTQNCLSCHQADGLGVDGMNPPLSKTSYVLGDKTRIVKVVLNGLQGVDIDGESYNGAMPSYDFLTDEQIADVLTYVRNSFGNKAVAVGAAEVKAVRAANKK